METAKQRAERFREALRLEGNKLIRPKRMRPVKGRFTLKGIWSSSVRSRHYSIKRKFTESEEIKTDRIELKPERFSLLINKAEEALIDVPAYLVKDPEFDGILRIPIIPSYRISMEKTSLEVSNDMEFAHLNLETNEWEIHGRSYVSIQNNRGARWN
ncbi:hypothetical protein [Thermococcus piezophilus]|uniref:hypothetical protein n=1 Tax=Thermococcus piezophilus TaxID=1712654 RepID=UPI0019014AF8|nr:hypothetical protein [Thermococcus piezophilus]